MPFFYEVSSGRATFFVDEVEESLTVPGMHKMMPLPLCQQRPKRKRKLREKLKQRPVRASKQKLKPRW